MKNNERRIEIGDCITIPAWQVEGMVIATRPAMLGSDDAQDVLLEVRPDDPQPQWYRLEPNEFRFEWETK